MSNTSIKNNLLYRARPGVEQGATVAPALVSSKIEDDEVTIYHIEVPGIDPSTVDVNCENNLLSVSCERGEFITPLEALTDVSKISADIKWGLLTIKVPAPARPVAKSIKVNILDAVEKKPYTNKPAEKFTKSED